MENRDTLAQGSWVESTQPQKKEIAPSAEKWLAHIWARDFVCIYKNMGGDNYQYLCEGGRGGHRNEYRQSM